MENKKWYAVMDDRDDNDWGYGSADRAEAEQMVLARLNIRPESYIAVIDEGEDPICIGEIYPADFQIPDKKYRVTYLGGPGRNTNDSVDWMLVKVGSVELYAEMENPTWNEEEERFEDECATFEDLKAEIIRQAEEKGLNPDWLNFD